MLLNELTFFAGVAIMTLLICINHIFSFMAPAVNNALFKRPHIYVTVTIAWLACFGDLYIFHWLVPVKKKVQ